MGFSRQEYWSGLQFPSPGELLNPGIEPRSLPHCRQMLYWLSYTRKPRDVLNDLLYSRHPLPYLHHGTVVRFPLGSQDQSPQPAQRSFFFACWLRGVRSPKWLGGCLNFQFNRIIVVTPGNSISPFWTKTSRPVQHKVMATGGKNSPRGSQGWMVSLPFLPLDSWACESWLWGNSTTIYWMLNQSIHSLRQNLAPDLQVDAIMNLLKAFPPFCQASCFRVVGNMKTSKFQELGPIAKLFFLWSEFRDQKPCFGITWWFIRPSVNPWLVSIGRSIIYREGKPISRIIVYSSKNKMFPHSWWKWTNVLNPPHSSLTIPGKVKVA